MYGKKTNFKIFSFLDKLDDSEHFLKKNFFLEILQVFWPTLYEKINFKIFSFLDQSDDSEHFFKGYYFWVFCPPLSEMKQLVGDSIKFAMKLYKKGSINEKSILFHLFFPCPPLGKNCSLVILVFPQGKKGKGKTEKNISRPRRCLGLKNLFSRFFLFLFYLGEKLKSHENNFSLRRKREKKWNKIPFIGWTRIRLSVLYLSNLKILFL